VGLVLGSLLWPFILDYLYVMFPTTTLWFLVVVLVTLLLGAFLLLAPEFRAAVSRKPKQMERLLTKLPKMHHILYTVLGIVLLPFVVLYFGLLIWGFLLAAIFLFRWSTR
jgi:hypothetical protein